MENTFELNLVSVDGRRVINFVNRSKSFVEIIFTINGKEVKRGQEVDLAKKGYIYPPKLENPCFLKDLDMHSYWGPINQTPKDREFKKDSIQNSFYDNDVTNTWLPDFKEWLDYGGYNHN